MCNAEDDYTTQTEIKTYSQKTRDYISNHKKTLAIAALCTVAAIGGIAWYNTKTNQQVDADMNNNPQADTYHRVQQSYRFAVTHENAANNTNTIGFFQIWHSPSINIQDEVLLQILELADVTMSVINQVLTLDYLKFVSFVRKQDNLIRDNISIKTLYTYCMLIIIHSEYTGKLHVDVLQSDYCNAPISVSLSSDNITEAESIITPAEFEIITQSGLSIGKGTEIYLIIANNQKYYFRLMGVRMDQNHSSHENDLSDFLFEVIPTVRQYP